VAVNRHSEGHDMNNEYAILEKFCPLKTCAGNRCDAPRPPLRTAQPRRRNTEAIAKPSLRHSRKSPQSGASRSSSILFNPFQGQGFGRGDGQAYFAIGSDNLGIMPLHYLMLSIPRLQQGFYLKLLL